jgi:hypothetical protein
LERTKSEDTSISLFEPVLGFVLVLFDMVRGLVYKAEMVLFGHENSQKVGETAVVL